MMNYDEAIKLIKKIDQEATEIIATDEEINLICNTLEIAKKEHELFQKKEKLLDLYQAVFGKSKPEYYEVTTKDLMLQIKELERELK